MVTRLWPQSGLGAILVTSRPQNKMTKNVAGDGKLLPPLEPDAAIDLMKIGLPRLVWNEKDKSEASKILKLVGFHPYSIIVVISQLNDAACSLEEYRVEYNLEEIMSASPPEGLLTPYGSNLAQLWAPTLAKLDPDSQGLMNVFALLDIDRCQIALLRPPTDEPPVTESGYIKKPVHYTKELLSKGLLYSNEGPASEHRSFHMHRLTQASTRMRMDGAARLQAFEIASYLVSAIMAPASDVSWPEVLEQYREFYSHAKSLFDYYNGTIAQDLAREKSKLPFCFIELLWKVGW